MKSKNIVNTIKENNGCFIYTYIDDHLNRVYGGSDYLKYGSETSDVYIVKNNIILNSRSEIKNNICSTIRKSNFLDFFNVKLNYPKSDKFYLRFARILNYIFLRTKKLKPNSNFIIGIYPKYGQDLKWIKFLNKKIRLIRVSTPKDFKEKKIYSSSR